MVRFLLAGAAALALPAAALACAAHETNAAAETPVVLAGGMSHAHGHGHAAPGEASLGDIAVTAAFARAAAAPGGASAAYMTLTTGGGPDRLLSAASPAAAKVELHTHTLDAQGVARMMQVQAIEVAPGSPTELKPGGLHVMLMGLTAPLAEGQSIPLTLTFEKAGAVTLDVPVRAVGAMPMTHSHGG
jgi:copper(I)-binding protein